MSTVLLVDAGPLVPMLAKRDQYHLWATAQARSGAAPMLTTEPVVTEAAHLLRRHGHDPSVLIRWIRQGALFIGLHAAAEAEKIEELMKAYNDQPTSLADATLVRPSEMFPQAKVFIMDSEFTVYRRFGNQHIPILSPY